MLPLPVPHGHVEVYGFRVGDLGYITDAKRLPPRTLEALRGVRVLVLNALWYGRPHPTHFNVEEAVEVALEIGAQRTYLTHLSHRVGHRELLERLPAGIEPAYDGLVDHSLRNSSVPCADRFRPVFCKSYAKAELLLLPPSRLHFTGASGCEPVPPQVTCEM